MKRISIGLRCLSARYIMTNDSSKHYVVLSKEQFNVLNNSHYQIHVLENGGVKSLDGYCSAMINYSFEGLDQSDILKIIESNCSTK